MTDDPTNTNVAWIVRQSLPISICDALLQSPHGPLRVMTVHPPASQQCTETLAMIQTASFIIDLLRSSKQHPTILAGDFNIHADTHCMAHYQTYFTLVTNQPTNTLNPRLHKGFQQGISQNGHHVDHILVSPDLIIDNRSVGDTDISDHLPVSAHLHL